VAKSVYILMTIRFEGGEVAPKTVLVATVDAFNGTWVPAARDCGLALIHAMADLEVTGEQVSLILDELMKLRTWFQEHLKPEEARSETGNVDRVLVALGEVESTREITISFRS
jgi:hypothetical protein